jgi:hypothetical protein
LAGAAVAAEDDADDEALGKDWTDADLAATATDALGGGSVKKVPSE